MRGQPAGQHGGLVVAALAQAATAQGYRQEQRRARQAVAETMRQPAAQQLRQQVPERPLAVVLEPADQRIQRKTVVPGRLNPVEGRCTAAALAAGQTVHRQRQGAHLAAIFQPGQVGFAGDAKRVGLVGGFIAQ
ncbi:hypothetical protein D9M71_582660 [compost metagenome]